MARRPGISSLGLIVVLASVVVAATIPIAPAEATIDPGSSVFLFTGLGLYWGLGALIVLRADGHTVGWLFVISAAMMAAVFGCCERTASAFSARMRDAIDLASLTDDLDATVRETIAPSRVGSWLR